jgi:hypothetical protein
VLRHLFRRGASTALAARERRGALVDADSSAPPTRVVMPFFTPAQHNDVFVSLERTKLPGTTVSEFNLLPRMATRLVSQLTGHLKMMDDSVCSFTVCRLLPMPQGGDAYTTVGFTTTPASRARLQPTHTCLIPMGSQPITLQTRRHASAVPEPVTLPPRSLCVLDHAQGPWVASVPARDIHAVLPPLPQYLLVFHFYDRKGK